MTEEQEPPIKRRRRRTAAPPGPPPCWPGDPEQAEAGTVDFEAIAHVLANTCRWSGRTRRFHSLAQHALTASEEIEALDGIPEEDRRAMALHALLADARAAWLGDEEGAFPGAAKPSRFVPRLRATASTGRCARPRGLRPSRRRSGRRCCASSPA